MRTVKIATRKSPLALWQANFVRAQLLKHHHRVKVELLELVTAGDQNLNASLADSGGKGLFLKELEQALLAGDADLAVHSMKDVTVTLPDGLTIAAVCERDDARDAFVGVATDTIDKLPAGATVGTSSQRRQCQLRARYPNLNFTNLRGNVGTRLKKLDDGVVAGVVLAAAGLKRLRLEKRIGEFLSPSVCLPAAGQGAVGVECRADDADTVALVQALNHADTAACVTAERAVNRRLGGDCHLPLAAFAELHGDAVAVRAMVGSVDGATILYSDAAGARADAAAVGVAAADKLLADGAADLIHDARG